MARSMDRLPLLIIIMAMVPLLLFTLTMRVAAAFNPMELFLDSKEGVSFAFEVDGVKQYSGEFLLSLMTI